MTRNIQQVYFDTPVDKGGPLAIGDIENFLKDDSGDEKLELEKPEEKTDEEEQTDEEDNLIPLKTDEEEPVLEDTELVVPVSQKKILAKYPNLFKDFPYLEKAYYADQAYKELLPTIDDAKEAVAKATALDGLETKLRTGEVTELLKSIKDADNAIFLKIVDNYLPSLAKVDQGAFNHVISNTIRQTILLMVNEAKRSNNTDLGKAAYFLNQFTFGNTELVAPSNLSKDTGKPEDDSQKQEHAKFIQERFDITREDLKTRVENVLKSTINDHIDPKTQMTDYVKKNAVREALEQTDKIIGEDTQFRKILDSLWNKAFEQNFNRESVNKIRSAYLSKARTVLPNVISKTRNEALKGVSKKSDNTSKSSLVRGTFEKKTTTQNSGNQTNRKMSTFDFLNSD